MTPAALTLSGVTKRYGARTALDALDLEVPTGRIAGLIGPNGAGKTTAFSIVAGYILPDAGSVDLLGRGPFDPHQKGLLGILPQDAALPERHTPVELLVHLGCLQGLSRRAARDEAQRVLAEVQLDDRQHERIHRLSHGMRRRVAVASALCGRPPLVLLDEPMAGLDPVQAASLRSLLDSLRGRHTLLISSHQLSELERLCDWVIVLEQGRCMQQGPLESLTAVTQVLRWRLGPVALPEQALRDAAPSAALAWDGELLEQQVGGDTDPDEVVLATMRVLVDHDIAVTELKRGISLEEGIYGDRRVQ